MTNMRRLLIIATTFLTLLTMLMPIASVMAQKDQETPVDTTKDQPKVVAITEVNDRIQKNLQRLKNISLESIQEKDITRMDSSLTEASSFLELELEAFKTVDGESMSKGILENLNQTWVGYYEMMDDGQNRVNKEISKLNETLHELEKERAVWQLTIESLEAEDVPDELMERISGYIIRIDEMTELMTSQSKTLIVMEDKAAEYRKYAYETIEKIEVWQRELRNSIFYQTAPPLWELGKREVPDSLADSTVVTEEADSLVANASYGIKMTPKDHYESIEKYFSINSERVYRHLVFFLILVLLFVWMRKQVRVLATAGKDAPMRDARQVFLRLPIPSVIFITVLLSVLLYAHRPLMLVETFLFIGLLSMLILTPPFTSKRYDRIGWFIMVLFLIDLWENFLFASGAGYRYFLLVHSFLMVGMVIYYVRPGYLSGTEDYKAFWKLILRLAPLLYVFLAVAILGNILGYVALAALAIKLVTQISVVTLIFLGIIKIVGGFAVGLIRVVRSRSNSFTGKYAEKFEWYTLQFIYWYGVYLWIRSILITLDVYKDVVEWLEGLMATEWTVGTVTVGVGGILSFIVILIITFMISGFIKGIIANGLLDRLNLSRGVPVAISLVIRYFIIVLGIVMAMSAAGIDLSRFNLMAGALGVGIGFGLQNVIYNFVSGLILVFERPIQTGDTVEIENLLGRVNRIGVRSSNVRTFDGAEVVVPNGNLISNQLINWTLSDKRKRIEIKVGAAYGSDPNMILELLKAQAVSNENVLEDPEPSALFENFGEYSLQFRLLFWVQYDRGLRTKSEVAIAVYNAFAEAGIEIPYPKRDIEMRDKKAPAKKVSGGRPRKKPE